MHQNYFLARNCDNIRPEFEHIHNGAMVTKSKLKMALAAEKGLDFKRLNLQKKEKLSRKKKAAKGIVDKPNGKKSQGEWEDVEEEGRDEEEDGAELGEGESGSEEDVDGPMKVSSSHRFNYLQLIFPRSISTKSTKATATLLLERMIKKVQMMRTRKIYQCLTLRIWTMRRRRT